MKKTSCVGCGACAKRCPTKAIEMIVDEKGFYYPKCNKTSCIHCGQCERVCPTKNQWDSHIEDAEFYAMISGSKQMQMGSASGGVFPEIAKVFLKMQGGLVWGAAFDTNFAVRHISINSEDQLPRLCRSKYVQSDTTHIFEEIERQLAQGTKVLFTGTPCQTAAVAKYIPSKLKTNLYLVDIVCHGVPSPLVWQEYLGALSCQMRESKEDIKEVYFKYKSGDKTWSHPGFLVKWNDGKEYLEFSNNTWYEKGFLENLYVRPACHMCKFKRLSSPSDITIGDFWGCKERYPDMFDQNGVSVVATKTEKGRQIVSEVKEKTKWIRISSEDACAHNQRIIKPAKANRRRTKFWRCFRLKSNNYTEMENLVLKLTRKTIVAEAKGMIKYGLKVLIGK